MRSIIYIVFSILLITVVIGLLSMYNDFIVNKVDLADGEPTLPLDGWIVVEIGEGEWILISINGDVSWEEKLRSLLQ